MSDPLQELRNLTQQGVDVTPLPASEVRRRGDRLRRRQHILAAVGGVAAIALIATPIALVSGGGHQALPPQGSESPSPTTTESATQTARPDQGTWLATIPAGFPLAEGWPEPTETGAGLGLTGPSADLAVDQPGAMCPATAVSVPPAVDKLAATWSQPEDFRSRQLLLFASDGHAQQYADWVRTNFADCDGFETGDGYIIASVIDFQPATFAWTATLRSELQGEVAPGVQLVQVAVIGNAVLINAGSDHGSDVGAMNNEYAGQVVDVLSAMDVFAGTTQTSVSPQTPVAHEITDDYPLVEGWPDDSQAESASFGLEGPSRSIAPMELTACGQALAYPTYVDRLSASWSNPEDYRHRQLMTFADADQAVAFVDEFAQIFRDCPVEPAGSDGYTPHHLVLDTRTGGQSVAVASYYEYDGSPAIGLQLIHVVRLGRAVLLISEYNEGGAGPKDEREAIFRQSIDHMTSDAAAPIAAMCAFTEAGC
jgi:hypothetical protein